jgi:molybdopterin-containing oxidoreductase family iron-sulfur binding subunit
MGHEVATKKAEEVNLWDDHAIGNHHWRMSIDLNSCIGCGACVVACQAENNVPVVGKTEVMRSREMHWIRIDRYYTSDHDPKDGHEGDVKKMEDPSDNPKVTFQPIMCQHCAHAPCETVCPVIATSHSSEGMNQMIYNRCVGTRYCANNCPYKVRRFNWFKYSDNAQFDFNMNNDLGKMVLNPDVVVRSRGVMEKCSLCVQRLQEGKLTAKKEGRPVADGEINTACAQTCPTQAITFGDFKQKDSRISKAFQPEERTYHLLEELDVQPNVFYQTKVRNVEKADA